MPTIAKFYWIIIYMHQIRKEHNPPHIHVRYGEEMGTVKIQDFKILSGHLSKRTYDLVKEFLILNQEELLKMWMSGDIKQLPPLQ
mgnify:CR=1 FL=1